MVTRGIGVGKHVHLEGAIHPIAGKIFEKFEHDDPIVPGEPWDGRGKSPLVFTDGDFDPALDGLSVLVLDSNGPHEQAVIQRLVETNREWRRGGRTRRKHFPGSE